ncbi:MAG: hypothetical protein ABFS23_07185 [Pseudomonadota bacterium]
MTQRIRLHIDRLVLRGVNPKDSARIVAALQAELKQRLVAPDMAQALTAGGDRRRIKVSSLRVGTGNLGQVAGEAIAGQLAGTPKR